jgi:putative photosynthetic complex assembly protein 2
MSFGLPATYTALLWWFATGTILLLIRRPERTYRATLLCATMLLGLALALLRRSGFTVTSGGAYVSFAGALLVWAWLEITFLTGYITGPQMSICVPRLAGARRFVAAARTVIYNELATLACGLAVLAATWGAPNRAGLFAYLILWGMRLSAKLNLFFGVPNLGERFLPAHLAYLKSYFRRRSMNALFPFSLAGGTALTVLAARRYCAAAEGFDATAWALLTSLLALGTLEHLFMVLPMGSEKLWNYFGAASPAVGGAEAASDVEGCPTSSG